MTRGMQKGFASNQTNERVLLIKLKSLVNLKDISYIFLIIEDKNVFTSIFDFNIILGFYMF